MTLKLLRSWCEHYIGYLKDSTTTTPPHATSPFFKKKKKALEKSEKNRLTSEIIFRWTLKLGSSYKYNPTPTCKIFYRKQFPAPDGFLLTHQMENFPQPYVPTLRWITVTGEGKKGVLTKNTSEFTAFSNQELCQETSLYPKISNDEPELHMNPWNSTRSPFIFHSLLLFPYFLCSDT